MKLRKAGVPLAIPVQLPQFKSPPSGKVLFNAALEPEGSKRILKEVNFYPM